MQDIRDSGFDYVVHCFTESDLLWGLESMREIVRISREIGLEVHLDPWGVAGVFGGEALSKYVTWNTDACQVMGDGSTVGVICLNQPKLLPFLKEWIDAGVDIGAMCSFSMNRTGIRATSGISAKVVGPGADRWSCRCAVCQELFRDAHGTDMPATRTAEVQKFRSDAVLRLTTELIGYAKSKGATTDLCLLPQGMTFDLVGVEDWDPFRRDSGTRYVWHRPLLAGWRSRADGAICSSERDRGPRSVRQTPVEDQYWVQGYGFPKGTEHEIADAIGIANEEGMTDIAIWSYRACEPMSKLWSEDIDASWAVVTETLARYRQER